MLSAGRAAFDYDTHFYAAVDTARAQLPADTFSGPLLGDDFDHEDDSAVHARYPGLAEIYL
jgi:hypothetical protein